MRLALRLAKRGAGRVAPNPQVGALVVCDGQIVGRGFHRTFGGPHAEIIALEAAGAQAKGATLYVTLEPCSHFGKTPPCAARIIAAGIRRVVAAMEDPNPLVHGAGFRALRDAGILVSYGVLEDRARDLNAPFVKFIRERLPYVTLKMALTLDGRIADGGGKSKWITSMAARRFVHRLRAETGAVLVGSGTVLQDNPALTVRQVRGMQPWRVVLDRRLRIPLDATLLTDAFASRTIVATSADPKSAKGREILKRGATLLAVPADLDGGAAVRWVLEKLAERGISQVLVEGGGEIFSSFIGSHSVDRLLIFIAPKIFGMGTPACVVPGFTAAAPLRLKNITWRRFPPDMLVAAQPDWAAADAAAAGVGRGIRHGHRAGAE